ncbi:unnamed protein product [Diatraea saccharalis]|uniref:Ketoreductase domain-containing protein n=1 Tax=Diatraea saccharalis TaxID=40085 RepID=A0A9N9R787_9NEOP|nr:unnamed protein product [Diatraea saccharalis]
MSFSDKVVIVTGASSGIGAATAIMFCREGASVALVGRNETKLKNVSQKCSAAGGKHVVIIADVSNDDDARRIVDNTIKKFGKLDILVNNAGVLGMAKILDGTILEAYDKIMKTNVRAVVHLTMLAAPHLVKTKGNIVNISSVAGKTISLPTFSAYATSKAALDHFTRGSASELASSGVRVNTVSPGPVATDIMDNIISGEINPDQSRQMIPPLQRVSQSDEIADLILYLASDRSIGITGSDFITDNGYLLK